MYLLYTLQGKDIRKIYIGTANVTNLLPTPACSPKYVTVSSGGWGEILKIRWRKVIPPRNVLGSALAPPLFASDSEEALKRQ